MKKEKFQIIILISIILFGLGYAYFKFLFLPQWIVIQESNNQLLSLENQYQELLTYQKDQNGLQQEIKTLETKIKQLDEQLPNQINKPELMVGLYTLAKKHTVDPQSIAFEQAQTKGTYQEMGMSLSCLGNTTNILAMIHDLQFGESQQLAITSISLTGSQQTMRAELKLMAYGRLESSSDWTQKPAFMESPFGMNSPVEMFQP